MLPYIIITQAVLSIYSILMVCRFYRLRKQQHLLTYYHIKSCRLATHKYYTVKRTALLKGHWNEIFLDLITSCRLATHKYYTVKSTALLKKGHKYHRRQNMNKGDPNFQL